MNANQIAMNQDAFFPADNDNEHNKLHNCCKDWTWPKMQEPAGQHIPEAFHEW